MSISSATPTPPIWEDFDIIEREPTLEEGFELRAKIKQLEKDKKFLQTENFVLKSKLDQEELKSQLDKNELILVSEKLKETETKVCDLQLEKKEMRITFNQRLTASFKKQMAERKARQAFSRISKLDYTTKILVEKQLEIEKNEKKDWEKRARTMKRRYCRIKSRKPDKTNSSSINDPVEDLGISFIEVDVVNDLLATATSDQQQAPPALDSPILDQTCHCGRKRFKSTNGAKLKQFKNRREKFNSMHMEYRAKFCQECYREIGSNS